MLEKVEQLVEKVKGFTPKSEEELNNFRIEYLGKKGFNINGIAPGGIENHQDQVFIDAYSKQVPMGRMAKADEILETLYLLATSGSNYINGQIIAIDGGWTTW